jgi:hypothetical protein
LSAGITQPREFAAEYPCSLKITLKDLDGNPILMGPAVTGSIRITVPYGSEINKSFTAADIDSAGGLPQNFITGLWPVGDGYTGAYTISDVSIDHCQFLGSYEAGTTGEAIWSGKFTGPGTCKYVTCYFGTIPSIPSGISTVWVDAASEIITDLGSYSAYDEDGTFIIDGKFNTGNLSESVVMPENETSDFNAVGIYFENTGSGSVPGLYIERRSSLNLHTGRVVFYGKVAFQNSGFPLSHGSIILSTAYENGTPAPFVDGSLIGETAGAHYGKVFFAKPVFMNGVEILEAGGYYFCDGLSIPDNISDLIPITKENYIN